MNILLSPGKSNWSMGRVGSRHVDWSLEIGGSVVRRESSGDAADVEQRWVNSEIAMQRVEGLIEASMALALRDWELYRAAKGQR